MSMGASITRACLVFLAALMPLNSSGQATGQTKELATLAVGDFFYSGDQQYKAEIGRFADSLQTYLVNSRKFTMVERSRLDQAFKEQGLTSASLVSSRIQEIGKLVGAQFIAYGEITDLQERDLAGTTIITFNVNISVMDATLGSIVWAGKMPSTRFGELKKIIDESAKMVSRRVMFSIYPITIASVNNGEIVLNYGREYLDRGQVLSIYKLGDEIKDPATGLRLGYNETLVGVAVVTDGLDKLSKAKPDESSVSKVEPNMLLRAGNIPSPPGGQSWIIIVDIDIAILHQSINTSINLYGPIDNSVDNSVTYNDNSITINNIVIYGGSGKVGGGDKSERRPTASIQITFTAGVDQYLTNELNSMQQLLQNYITDGGIFDVVDRAELTNLFEERIFSYVASPAGEQQQIGRDASADYVITISVSELRNTQVKRGSMLTQYVGLVSARVVDTERGTPLTAVRTEIKDFFPSGAQVVNAMAEKLAREINDSARKELTGEDALVKGTAAAEAAEVTVLMVRPNGDIMVSDDSNTLAVGDELTVYQVEEFPDPRNPSAMLKDEVEVGVIKVDRKGNSGAFAKSLTPGVIYEQLMIARKKTGDTAAVANAASGAAPAAGDITPAVDPRSQIAQTGVKPTLHIGKFKYSNEFDLSQTKDRTSGSNAGNGTLAVLGAVVGGVLEGGKPEEWIGDAVVGGVVGGAFDGLIQKNQENEAQALEEERDFRRQLARQDKTNLDKDNLDKESPVLREMVLTKAHASQRFEIIEDTRLGEVQDYMDRETNGNFSADSLVKRGGLKSAKYSAFGTILRFETNSEKKGFSIAGGSEQVEMILTMALRVVDNETGSVVVSDQISGSIETGSSQLGFLGFGTSSENQGAIGELMDVLAKNVMAKIVTSLYPIQIIDVNAAERVVMINAGETVVNKRDRLTLFQPGEKVFDPYSGMELGSSEQEVGEIEVFETQARFSKARIIRPVDDVSSVVKRGQICRQTVAKTASGDRSKRDGGF